MTEPRNVVETGHGGRKVIRVPRKVVSAGAQLVHTCPRQLRVPAGFDQPSAYSKCFP